MIYLDNSATTRPCEAAVRAMTEALTETWENPSSLYEGGIAAAHKLEDARKQTAAALGAEAERVFFTSGGTEADNWAILGTAKKLGKRGKHIITTAIEHPAVLRPMQALEAAGYDVTYLAPEADGFVPASALEAALRKDTILVSCMMVNNEVGAVQPIAEMIRAVRRKSPIALFHTDAVQGFGKIAFRAKTLGADLISVSSHKIHGPKGAGALYIKAGLQLPALLLGGGQEKGFRSGTEGTPALRGFGAACAELGGAEEIAKITELRDFCRQELSRVEGLQMLGRGDAPHIICVSLPGLRSQGILNCLQDRGIAVSAGSACSRGHRSHVLTAMGVAPEVIDSAVRISLSRDNTKEELAQVAEAFEYAKRTLKG
ncbi:MAG: cysteine desulfurase [Oscillospiraceae bacterium]|nr:cysteine desulfurase [Oscillospiraceae bacterium]MBR2366853.1 cysteine desulfurase [Oscillospiraceae bacterium]MBR2977030.1 cysteine desulfurase [Oscillospiraceae bacterium]MBR3850015.1 cysteine desulfurase [Oscillospiraceae bacterium]